MRKNGIWRHERCCLGSHLDDGPIGRPREEGARGGAVQHAQVGLGGQEQWESLVRHVAEGVVGGARRRLHASPLLGPQHGALQAAESARHLLSQRGGGGHEHRVHGVHADGVGVVRQPAAPQPVHLGQRRRAKGKATHTLLDGEGLCRYVICSRLTELEPVRVEHYGIPGRDPFAQVFGCGDARQLARSSATGLHPAVSPSPHRWSCRCLTAPAG